MEKLDVCQHPTKIRKQNLLSLRRIRLVVRTQGSQLWNRGSIPLCATKIIKLKCEATVEVKSAHFHSHRTRDKWTSQT